MQFDALIQKAALLLDSRQDFPGAISVLREAIAEADRQELDIPRGEARVFLAEVLVQQGTEPGRLEARGLLEQALHIASRSTAEPDLLGPWRLAASELLLELEASDS